MIGAYVHHHGSGHLHRVASVLAAVDDEVTVLTSADVPPGVLPAHCRLVTLPGDVGDVSPVDPTAGGALHWAPTGDTGYRARMVQLADWVGRTDPAALWVDVSVEVTAAARLLGVPVVGTLMPGRRVDAPHRTGFGLACALLAAWPPGAQPLAVAEAPRPVTEVGGVSRFEGRERAPRRADGPPVVARLAGRGGSTTDALWARVRELLPDVGWWQLGGEGGEWHADPWPALCAADLVVGAAGQGTVADLACLDGHALLVPEERPFGEQDATAAALANVPGVTTCARDTDAGTLARAVSAALDRARERPASGFRAAWAVDGAAARAAGVLARVAA